MNVELSDDALINGFEACSLPDGALNHRAHVRVVWIYLLRMPVMRALERFRESLRRYAASKGRAELYHETITFAFVFLINERIERSGRGLSWPAFVEANPDLFEWTKDSSVLSRYYRSETLSSDLARRVYIMPDGDGGRRS
jgi:hypothetical protein